MGAKCCKADMSFKDFDEMGSSVNQKLKNQSTSTSRMQFSTINTRLDTKNDVGTESVTFNEFEMY